MAETLTQAKPKARSAGKAATSSRSRRVQYDAGFEPAISAGLLSPYEAAQRGKRQDLAERLSRRHRIPVESALQVADNRISLPAAMAHARARPRAEVRTPPKAPARTRGVRSSRIALIGVAIGLVATAALILSGLETPLTPARSQRPAPGPEAGVSTTAPEPEPVVATPSAPEGATVLKDSLGSLTRIEGRDPQCVLLAYCAADRFREPAGILLTGTARPNLRLAVFRDTRNAAAPAQILRIHRQQDGRGWFAGDGSAPIPVRDAPADLDETSIRPIR